MESIEMKEGIPEVQAAIIALTVSSIHKYLKNNCDEWKDKGNDGKSLMETLKLGVLIGQLEQVKKPIKLNNDQKPQNSKKRLATTQAKPKDNKSAPKAKKAKKNVASSTKNGDEDEI